MCFPEGPACRECARPSPGPHLPAFCLPSFLLEERTGHLPEVTDSFQQLDSSSIRRAGVLISPEGDP